MLNDIPDISLIEETSSGEEALELVREHDPDVLVAEMVLPDVSGVHIAESLSESNLKIPILALSAYDDRYYIRHVLENGIAGYVMKQDPPDLVMNAIRAVARGEKNWMSPQIARKALALQGEKLDTNETIRDRGITPGEWRVLKLAISDITATDIAAELNREVSTVRTHLSMIYKKLGVSGRRGLIVWAAKHGMIAE